MIDIHKKYLNKSSLKMMEIFFIAFLGWFVVGIIFLGFRSYNLSQPIFIDNDAMHHYLFSRIQTDNTLNSNPNGINFSVFPWLGILNEYLLKFSSFLTNNSISAVNVFFLIQLFFVSILSSILLNYQKIELNIRLILVPLITSSTITLGGNLNHMMMSPWPALLFFLVTFLSWNDYFEKNTINKSFLYLLISFLSFLIGLSYIYWIAFILILNFSLIIYSLLKNQIESLKCAILSSSVFLVTFLISNLKYFISINSDQIAQKNLAYKSIREVDFSGLHLRNFFLPRYWHFFPNLIGERNYLSEINFPLPGEGEQYFGILAIIGFLIIIKQGIYGKSKLKFKSKSKLKLKFLKSHERKIKLLTIISFISIIFSVKGGFGSLLNMISGIKEIRVYSRMVPFIYLSSILTIGYLLSNFIYKINSISKKLFITTLSILMMFFFIYENLNYKLWNQLRTISTQRIENLKPLVENMRKLDDIPKVLQAPFISYPYYWNSFNKVGQTKGGTSLLEPSLLDNEIKYSYPSLNKKSILLFEKIWSSGPEEPNIKLIKENGFNQFLIDKSIYADQKILTSLILFLERNNLQMVYEDESYALFKLD